MFLLSAREVASNVSDADLEKGSIYPPLGCIQECSIDIACKIADYAYRHGKFLCTRLIAKIVIFKSTVIFEFIKYYMYHRFVRNFKKQSSYIFKICRDAKNHAKNFF